MSASSPGQMVQLHEPSAVSSGVVHSVDAVIVTYNRPAELVESCRMLAAQTVAVRRLVIVDNGDPEPAAPKAAAVPPGWVGRQVYEVEGRVGLPGDTDELRSDRREIVTSRSPLQTVLCAILRI